MLQCVLMRVITRAVCLEEGYNIVAAHTQKPMPHAHPWPEDVLFFNTLGLAIFLIL